MSNQSDEFGFSVCIKGDLAIIGATNDDGGSFDGNTNTTINKSGAAYIYKTIDDGDTWTFQERVKSAHASQNSVFGNSIAMSENMIAISNPNIKISNNNNVVYGAGGVYIYKPAIL